MTHQTTNNGIDRSATRAIFGRCPFPPPEKHEISTFSSSNTCGVTREPFLSLPFLLPIGPLPPFFLHEPRHKNCGSRRQESRDSFSPCTTNRLIAGTESGGFTLWNGSTYNFETRQSSHEAAVRAMRWSHGNQSLLSAGDDEVIKHWQPTMRTRPALPCPPMPRSGPGLQRDQCQIRGGVRGRHDLSGISNRGGKRRS